VNEIDKAFSKYSKLIDSQTKLDRLNPFQWNRRKELLERIDAIREERKRAVRASAECAATASIPDGMEKWLGNATRDFLQFAIYNEAHSFLEGVKRKSSPGPTSIYLLLLEYLFTQINFSIRRFGLASHRNAEQWVGNDLDRLFSILLVKHEEKPKRTLQKKKKKKKE
jgi:hypothetical protein